MDLDKLHPDLRPWVGSWVCSNASRVRHPLVFYTLMHDPSPGRDDIAEANKFYAWKKECLAKATTEKDGHNYVWAHERPYRLQALLDVYGGFGLDGAEFGELLGHVWIDSENIFQNRTVWRDLWSAPDVDVAATMDDEERSAFAALPDIVTVYRGTQHPRARAPLSWTLDRNKARWFALRFASGDPRTGFLLTGQARKKDIKVFFSGRNEAEVIALRVKVVAVQQVEGKLVEAESGQ